nr:MAG TPA: hypothetical protein [Caudoviricetes sp.]
MKNALPNIRYVIQDLSILFSLQSNYIRIYSKSQEKFFYFFNMLKSLRNRRF